ncbi:MAG: [citrate (pro-3S)-lyase] ligase [Lachnospiraceae bacterium]|nr:[citrate (pro-3S)-lyase] ligase [Lachnospiraceae bacterium]
MLMEGRPLQGRELEQLKQFLSRMELTYDDGIEYSVCILDENYDIIGTGSVDHNVIKCVAIDPEHQGQGLSASVISSLVQYEFEQGRTQFFIYTKPKNLRMFADMGFYTILQTPDILFMENRASGFAKFLSGLKAETPPEALNLEAGAPDSEPCIGAVVANCNPFTKGHRYLIEQALKQCDYLHLFVLSDNRSFFSAEERYQMVQEGVRDLPHVILHRTSDYMISAATFPTYFFKDQMQGEKANCRLDLELFAQRIAGELHITKRFVGTEPFCSVTRGYNEEMKQVLPAYGITVTEIERTCLDEVPVSASEVRRCLEAQDHERIQELVPNAVYEYLCRSGRLSSGMREQELK